VAEELLSSMVARTLKGDFKNVPLLDGRRRGAEKDRKDDQPRQ
jgi:hypothetical protein